VSKNRGLSQGRGRRTWDIYAVGFLYIASLPLGLLLLSRSSAQGQIVFGIFWVETRSLLVAIHLVYGALCAAAGVGVLLRSRFGFWMVLVLNVLAMMSSAAWWIWGRAVMLEHGVQPIGACYAFFQVGWYAAIGAWCWVRREAFTIRSRAPAQEAEPKVRL